MKKKFLSTLIVLVLILLADYLLIPNFVKLNSQHDISVTQDGLHRMLLTPGNVTKWWPGTRNTNGELVYNGNIYTFSNNSLTLIPVTIKNETYSIVSTMLLRPLKKDVLNVEWVCVIPTSYYPVKRFTNWLKIKKIKADMIFLLDKMNTFYSNHENIYGIKVEKQLVSDSLLITTGASCKGYPDTRFIYTLINKLRNYAAIKNAKAVGYPMLNVETEDGVTYSVRTALPLNKIIPGNGSDIAEKRMLGKGNILVAEVTGGISSITEALKQINIYARDYQRIPPAIPFFSLVTDRMLQPDTSKWITKVYCPVM